MIKVVGKFISDGANLIEIESNVFADPCERTGNLYSCGERSERSAIRQQLVFEGAQTPAIETFKPGIQQCRTKYRASSVRFLPERTAESVEVE